MATRPARRLSLSGGELVPPGANHEAQWWFLEAVRLRVPAVMHSLVTLASTIAEDDDALRTWCQEWGLTAAEAGHGDWLLTVVRKTAAALRDAADGEPRRWSFGVAYWAPVFPPPPAWAPEKQTAEAYRTLVDRYIAEVRAAALASGWTDPPEKRTPLHFEWLARYQVQKWTQGEIAQHYQDYERGLNTSAVSRALTGTAAMVGLALRPAARRSRR